MLRHAADLPRSINPNEMTPNNKIINYIVHPSYAAEKCPDEALSRTLSYPSSPLTEISRSAASPNGHRQGGQIHDPGSFVAAATPAALPQIPHSPAYPLIDPHDFIVIEGCLEKKLRIICGRPYSRGEKIETYDKTKSPEERVTISC